MKSGPFAFVRTTTFRLALVYSVLFALFSAGLLAYLFQATVGAGRAEVKSRLESEFRTLAVAWNTGGPTRLEQSLLERSLVQIRDFTYQFEAADGGIIQGDMPHMPVAPPDTVGDVREVHFEVERPISGSAPEISRIEARITRLGDGSTLLVGIKTDDRVRAVRRVTQAVATAAPIGILLALLGGFFSSRYAARRAEALTKTAEAVMRGDLSQRVDVVGSGDEFDRLAGNLNDMLSRLEKLMETTRHAGDSIAHDLRSPLSRLRNRLEATLRGPIDEVSARQTLEHTVDEVDRVLSTFNAILSLSRVNAGSDQSFEKVNITELAEEMAELFEPACEEASLSFDACIESDLLVKGDMPLLAQAMSNLLDNAVKYTPAGGAIKLSATKRDKRVLVIVEDSGPGIPPEAYERVMRRFVRLDEARTQTGSGLGLALVDAVAELHKGEVILAPGGTDDTPCGLKVTLVLPRDK